MSEQIGVYLEMDYLVCSIRVFTIQVKTNVRQFQEEKDPLNSLRSSIIFKLLTRSQRVSEEASGSSSSLNSLYDDLCEVVKMWKIRSGLRGTVVTGSKHCG